MFLLAQIILVTMIEEKTTDSILKKESAQQHMLEAHSSIIHMQLHIP
jgi:hypothetical protein